MDCPHCSYTHSLLVNIKPALNSEIPVKTRECTKCGVRFKTIDSALGKASQSIGRYRTPPPLQVLTK